MTRLHRTQPLLVFVGLALLVNTIATMMSHAFLGNPRRPLVSAGAFVDMLVVVPLLYYFLVARRGERAWLSTLPVLFLSAIRATWVFPDLLPGRALIGAGGEIGLLTLISLRVRNGIRDARSRGSGQDVLAQIEAVTAQFIASAAVSKVLAWELAIFYYALASWRLKPDVPAGSRGFSTHQESGFATLLGLISCLSVIEVAVMHLVVHRWNPVLAWVLTAAGIYGMLWLTALARSIVLRPVLVSATELEVRFGILWTLRIPRSAISAVRRSGLNEAPGRKTPQYLRLSPGADPKVLIELHEPIVAQGPYGLRKAVTKVGLGLDDAPGFVASLGLLP